MRLTWMNCRTATVSYDHEHRSVTSGYPPASSPSTNSTTQSRQRVSRPTGFYRHGTHDVHVRSLREGVDTSTPTGRAVTSIMATIAELELELGKERRAASREARVARGLAATKPMKLDAAQQKRLLRLYQQGEPVSELTTMFGISRSTLFRTLKVLRLNDPVISGPDYTISRTLRRRQATYETNL